MCHQNVDALDRGVLAAVSSSGEQRKMVGGRTPAPLHGLPSAIPRRPPQTMQGTALEPAATSSASTAACAFSWPRRFSEKILSIAGTTKASLLFEASPKGSHRMIGEERAFQALSFRRTASALPWPCLDLGSRRSGLERTPLRSSAARSVCQFQRPFRKPPGSAAAGL